MKIRLSEKLCKVFSDFDSTTIDSIDFYQSKFYENWWNAKKAATVESWVNTLPSGSQPGEETVANQNEAPSSDLPGVLDQVQSEEQSVSDQIAFAKDLVK